MNHLHRNSLQISLFLTYSITVLILMLQILCISKLTRLHIDYVILYFCTFLHNYVKSIQTENTTQNH